jgi:fucose permease
MKLKTLPIFLAFLLMGVADAMGPLSSAVKENFRISTVMATMMPFFVFIAFAIFSVPGGMLAARIGKKNVLLLGLVLNTLAVGVPAFTNPTYVVLLCCIFLLGVGTTFLQVAGNPIMRDISAEGDYSRNLALAQGIKGVGSASASFLPSIVMSVGFLAGMQWRGSFPIFFALMALALISVATLKVNETKAEKPPGIVGSLALLGNPIFALAVVGIFLYVGAEVCMATFLGGTLAGYGFTPKQMALFGPFSFFLLLTIGRLIAGSVKFSPRMFFRVSAFLGLVGTLLVLSNVKEMAILGVLIGGLGFANIWPMLFSVTVEEKPERASELSGLMCMAISGGALVPLLMAGILDSHTNQFAAGATITQEASGAAGTIVSWDKDSKTLAFTQDKGNFDAINIISQTAPAKATSRPVGLAGWKVNVTSGQFEPDAVVTQAATKATGKVVSWNDSTKVLLVKVTKDPKATEDPQFNTTDSIAQETPAASATPVAPVFRVEATNGGLAFIVPAGCFAYLLLLSLKGGKKPAVTPAKA